MPPPLVSIVVITLNTPNLTRACLRSVIRNTSVPYELIVINNSRSPGIQKTLRAFPEIRVIQNRGNAGFAKAANQGALAARGRYVCFLNSDVLVPPGWLERLVGATQQPGVGAAGPTSQHIHCFKWDWPPKGLPANEASTTLADQLFQRWGKNRLETMPYLFGFCLLIPKVVMARVGLFDEGYFFGVEDIDYSLKLRLAGYRLVRVHSLFVHHKGSGSAPSEHRRRLVKTSEKFFVQKWGTPLYNTPADYQKLLAWLNRKIPLRRARSRQIGVSAPRKRETPGWIRSGFTMRSDQETLLVRSSDLEIFRPDPRGLELWRGLSDGAAFRNGAGKQLALLRRRGLIQRMDPTAPAQTLVTVMMTAHNMQPWIAEAIESVLAQRFKQFELVIVDDGSTDRTAQIASSYLWSPRVRFLQNPRQMGIAAARNRILGEARGKYIAVCDADDIMLPSHLKRMVAFLETRRRVGWVYANRLRVDETGTPLGVERAERVDGSKEWERNVIAHAGALIRTEAMLKAGGYDETLMTSEDYDLGLKIARNARMMALPREMHYLWRRYPESASHLSPWRRQDTDRLLRRAKQRLRA